MKATLRIPTREQYSYIECEFEGTELEILNKYDEMTRLVHTDSSLLDKDFNKVLDQYIWGSGTMTAEEWEGMSDGQKNIIQVIKRSRARNKTT